jgi:hypothetical protein
MPDDIAEKGYDAASDTWISEDRLVGMVTYRHDGFCMTHDICLFVTFREVEIKAGCGVRLRIIGITVETEIKAVGSIKDDYLGLISAE